MPLRIVGVHFRPGGAARASFANGSAASRITAHESGYFDQAHLYREWVELTSVSPGDFLSLRSTPAKENHLALPGGSNLSNTPPHLGRRLLTERRSGK